LGEQNKTEEGARAMTPNSAPHIVLVAGETSGDNLGAQLIEALREKLPHVRFSGIAGPKMRAVGCEAWERSENFAVMGLLEVLPELPRLLRIRRQLIKRMLDEPPAVYIGVDFKEFNLSVAKRLKKRGVRTIQYVSPQVWAWRQGRARNIAQAVDMVLCLLPFEKQFYDAQPLQYRVDARFIGHPLADQIPLQSDRRTARSMFGLSMEEKCVALLPGSRRSEVARLAPDFSATVAWLLARHPQMRFIAPMASEDMKAIFVDVLTKKNVADKVLVIDGQSQEALAACDVALLASGTATLEALLVKRPMVVVYRIDAVSTFFLRDLGLVKAPYFAQPNLLAGRRVVPEYLNQDVRAEILGPALIEQLERVDKDELLATFAAIHQSLRRDASRQAAQAIIDLINRAN
jgi:lipid-A-disaccharide synthase